MFYSLPIHALLRCCVYHLLLLAWGLSSIVGTAAADTGTSRNIELRLVSSQGQPVSGATVTPVSATFSPAPNLYLNSSINAREPVLSDRRGNASLTVTAPRQNKEFTFVGLVVRVTHNSYVTTQQTVRFKDSPLTMTLAPGRRIAVSAVDELTGERIESHLHGVLDKFESHHEWQLLNNGILLSGGVSFDCAHLRLIQISADGIPRFSRLLDLAEHGKARRILLNDIPVRSGFRLEGKLDPEVPRPVHNGTVSVLVSGGPNVWEDTCEIQDDGTFVVESLPRGEVVQVTAVCDGWVSSSPTRAELVAVDMSNNVRRLQPSRLYPQVFRTEELTLHPVIQMEEAAACRVLVRDVAGKPVSDAIVSLSPFQGSFDGRSTIVGQRNSTLRSLLVSPADADRSRSSQDRNEVHRYQSRTGPDGVAIIESLPGGPDGSPAMTSVTVRHPNYERAPHDGLGDRGLQRAVLYQGQEAAVTFRMRKK